MILRLISMLLVLTLVMPLLVAQTSVSDDAIFDDVRLKLASDPDVRGGALDVQVKDGVVTLQGRVHTEKGRQKATTLTKKVKGVKSVNNQLKLYSDK
ncbi:MAG: BON domain-containing protein [Bryobacteraceae bacterium]